MSPLSLLAILVVVSLPLSPRAAHAQSKEEGELREGCAWLDRALAREPDRDDAFGMFMRGLMPKCMALLEGLARGDRSVRPEGMKAVVNELAELRQIVDGEHGGPPPATGRPTPDEVAKKKIADERAGVDAEAAKKAEAERQAAEEARRIEAEKKAAEEEARRKEKEAREAAEAQRRLEEQRAKETAKEKREREAAEKKAEAERKREEAKLEAERKAAERREAEALERERKAREAAEKKAAEEAKREEARRLEEERKAAEAAKKMAEKQAKEQALAEAEARRLIEDAEREAVEEQRKVARNKAAELVANELAAADEEARRERQRLADESRRANEESARDKATAKGTKAAALPRGPLDGTWEQPPSKVLDRNVKRTLNLFTKDGKVQGELFEEVWYPAPSAWIDKSCEGNTTFRMVTSARVSGEGGKDKLVLWREVPRVLTCTCPSRCTVETRRRGFDLKLGPNGRELSDGNGVFVRPGTAIVSGAREVSEAAPGPVVKATADSFAGAWETRPMKRRDETVVRRLELEKKGDKLVGTLVERSSQGLPLQSWSQRFCGGASAWEWVTRWEVSGKPKGTALELKGDNGANLSCSCPSKCRSPKAKLTFDASLGATGGTLTVDGDLFERK